MGPSRRSSKGSGTSPVVRARRWRARSTLAQSTNTRSRPGCTVLCPPRSDPLATAADALYRLGPPTFGLVSMEEWTVVDEDKDEDDPYVTFTFFYLPRGEPCFLIMIDPAMCSHRFSSRTQSAPGPSPPPQSPTWSLCECCGWWERRRKSQAETRGQRCGRRQVRGGLATGRRFETDIADPPSDET